MNFRTERCPVGDITVTLVCDFEGTITMVICPDFDYAHGTCVGRRNERTAPLRAFFDRVSPHPDDRTPSCVYSVHAVA